MILQAIKIDQPLASFYLTKIKAKDLLEIAFSERLEYIDEDGRLKGSQRQVDESRLKEIGRYIDSVEMAFPNSIILAANYNESGEIVDDIDIRWSLIETNPGIFEINIPTKKKLAAIIDGQHRLYAFDYLSNEERINTELPCSIFFDLPNSYQAFLFATINGNQKKVNKSLALEQFGFNVADEPKESWTPEKLSVYITRKLNFSSKLQSPFYNRIKVAPSFAEFIIKNSDKNNWTISTATLVSGILSLISTNPKRDRVEMGQRHIFKGRDRSQLKAIRDSSPLRQLYLDGQDDVIIKTINSFFHIVDELLWHRANNNSYIFKTVGIQALFDLLKKLLSQDIDNTEDSFKTYLVNVSHIDFSDNYFQASGTGRSRIRNVLYYYNGLIEDTDLKESDLREIKRFTLRNKI